MGSAALQDAPLPGWLGAQVLVADAARVVLVARKPLDGPGEDLLGTAVGVL